jgi:hypothetical protein
MALPFMLKNIRRHMKNYENSNISPCKNIVFKKLLQNTKTLMTIAHVAMMGA